MVKVGDAVQAGIAISNSEVGQGSLRVEALDYRLVRTNGMIRETAVRKRIWDGGPEGRTRLRTRGNTSATRRVSGRRPRLLSQD